MATLQQVAMSKTQTSARLIRRRGGNVSSILDLRNENSFERDRFRLLVDSVRDYAIFMLDPEGHILTWNAGAERIKGYSAEEAIGKHFSIFYGQDDIRSGKPAKE